MGRTPFDAVIRHVRRTVAPSEPDSVLIERFVSHRDERAFAALVRRHGPAVMAACRCVLRDPADLDDAFQATFLVLWKKAGSIRSRSAIGGWLYGVAHRVAIRALAGAAHRRRRESESSSRRVESCEAPDLSLNEACAILHAELDRLPDKFRLPLLLCYLDGKSRDEAARQLGITAGALKGSLERGRNLLRNRLIRRGIALSAGLFTVLHASGPYVLSAGLVSSTMNAALAASAASGRAFLLAQGVIQTMRTTHRLVMAFSVLAFGTVGASVGLWARNAAPVPSPDPPVARVVAPIDKPRARESIKVRVLDPDGKTVTGARLYFLRLMPGKNLFVSDENLEIVKRELTATDGEFTLDMPGDRFQGRAWPVMAFADGYGLGWAVPSKPGEDLTIRLVKDEPIVGRVVDADGKPVANARIRICDLFTGRDDRLDAFIDGWKANWNDTWRHVNKRTISPKDAVVVTPPDADGRFRITGAGVDRVVVFEISGPGIATFRGYLITRPGFDPKSYNEASQRPSPGVLTPNPVLFGPQFSLVAAPGKSITGVVRDIDGKPFPGARAWTMANRGCHISAVSDANGRFTLTGLPKKSQYYLSVSADGVNDKPVSTQMTLADTDGLTPIKAEVILPVNAIWNGASMSLQSGWRWLVSTFTPIDRP